MVVGPILSQSRSDVFCDNENGANFLFKNNGDGTFADVARQAGGLGKEENESIQYMTRGCVLIPSCTFIFILRYSSTFRQIQVLALNLTVTLECIMLLECIINVHRE